jgi:Protein of unknown function (DUF1326)
MRMLRTAALLVFTFVLSSLAIAVDETKSAPKDVPDFDVYGISMTECQCTAYACPCRSNGHPDHGSCDAADFTYIKQGRYGKVDMGGFKAVVIGDLIDHDVSKVQGTVYFDKSSTPKRCRQATSLRLTLASNCQSDAPVHSVPNSESALPPVSVQPVLLKLLQNSYIF